MTRTHILSIDPGKSTGVALGYITDDAPYTLVNAWQIEGGLAGFLEWAADLPQLPEGAWYLPEGGLTTLSEKFQPINHSNYALTTESVEPLRIEGAMIAQGIMPDYDKTEKRWRSPKDQYIVGGADLQDKKKRAHKFLKDSGMYVTGKDVGCKDANDARSAILHGVSYAMKVLKHKPTWTMVNDWSNA